MSRIQKLTPCLWFDDQAEAAAQFYCSVFEHSTITAITHYGKAGFELHGRPEGSVMTVSFMLDGQTFTALNGGPVFRFSEAISFQVNCHTQYEIDHFWNALSAGGDKQAQQCGWLKDKFGLSWQIVPVVMMDMMTDRDTAKSQRVMQAMLQMKKLDIATLERAFNGES
ncbi:3-demethylubiquinone-9 3-methyltransferase [Pseudomonas fluorescens HK44]|uniref:3-demethylubiquinone-9 3-methyltransferase n=1 Tax=Pseudomonas fluorescens HK44 TaxID=1042209 RepID=A0A010T6N6_PSEFL|nr:VOC family protein [Pseudomonas fluorescens]EXF93122.1 3-demethylubiquinone-9 3-methyltransferase [Pseudomonas fluorescens HK44]